jgi:hypothetical protein
MNLPEVGWRLQQKRVQRQEQQRFRAPVSVCSCRFNPTLFPLSFHAGELGIAFENATYGCNTSIHLLGGFDYDSYKQRWRAGFQTEREWENTFSYALNYKQRDEIGDARSNWELNRHFQFALLAKAYKVSKQTEYLEELQTLFESWNQENPFLHGISWTSVMEVAIRCIQWCIARAFLEKEVQGTLLEKLETGIVNMADYVAKHYSRYSSANNHVLVEATALAYAGYAFDYAPWKQLAFEILNQELLKQNYTDGVNKEMALHYQTFGMEAYALVMHLMQRHGETIPVRWSTLLNRQCTFVACSLVGETDALEFGDNDEGKILDLQGGDICHYRYLLQLCSMVLDVRYDDFTSLSETLRWLFAQEEIERVLQLPQKRIEKSMCFSEGGYSFLRSNNQRVVIGIDHAPLGFGSIAAHGHADALSFQLYVDGKCILGDPGTYIYHCNLPKRNDYRRSMNHNTVWVKQAEQSCMMGAFLWGKKAETHVQQVSFKDAEDTLQAECIWQNGYRHERYFRFNKKDTLSIKDTLQATEPGFVSLMVHPECTVAVEGNTAILTHGSTVVRISAEENAPEIQAAWYSTEYGKETKSKRLVFALKNNKIETTIWIEKY